MSNDHVLRMYLLYVPLFDEKTSWTQVMAQYVRSAEYVIHSIMYYDLGRVYVHSIVHNSTYTCIGGYR